MLNAFVDSPFGDADLNLSYTSSDIKNLKLGVVLHLAEVDVAEVINLIPQVDTLMPMLKSLEGVVTFDLAAVSKLDSLGNFQMDNTNGMASLYGSNLAMKDTEPFEKILNLMKFQKPEELLIPSLRMNVFLYKGEVEVKPVYLAIDRYKAAVHGTQWLNGEMDYHISVIESPLVIRVGANVFGPMKDFKFRLETPHYKKVELIPNTMSDVDLSCSETLKYINSVIK